MIEYKDLFSDEKSKAEAFDEIARAYYNKNFGRMSKTDFETLLFHLYFKQVISHKIDKASESDFSISKALGITQSKVSSLKVRDQLTYPREIMWREELAEASKNLKYEQGRIKIQIQDINVFYEIKNAIEQEGGFIDVSLTPRLLQVPPVYILDLLVAVSKDKDRDFIRKSIREKYRDNCKDTAYIEKEPTSKTLGKLGEEALVAVLNATISAVLGNTIGVGTSLGKLANNILKAFSFEKEE